MLHALGFRNIRIVSNGKVLVPPYRFISRYELLILTQEAVSAATHEQFDVILMDIMVRNNHIHVNTQEVSKSWSECLCVH